MTPQDEDFKKWKNINGALALMSSQTLFDGSSIALACLSRALEYDEIVTTENETSIYTMILIHLPIAAIWMSTSLDHLWDLCKANACSDEKEGGPLWDGKGGFSGDRWTFWWRRFNRLSNHRFATEEVHDAADHAFRWMPSCSR